jgi:predicted  nucleic acid-binding Zn-ribbon protein
LIIAQLKAEIFDLRENQRQEAEIEDQVANLEEEIDIVQEDTAAIEADYKRSNESSHRTIAALKSEIDDLKHGLKMKREERQRLLEQNVQLRGICETREQAIAQHKRELEQISTIREQAREDTQEVRKLVLPVPALRLPSA